MRLLLVHGRELTLDLMEILNTLDLNIITDTFSVRPLIWNGQVHSHRLFHRTLSICCLPTHCICTTHCRALIKDKINR